MIAWQAILNIMTYYEEPCIELNEIIYRISGEFWKQAYYSLLRRQKDYAPDPDISIDKAIFELRRGIRNLTIIKKMKCNMFSHNEHYYMSLTPFPIYVGIEKDTGDFSISAPHISTKQFKYSEYLGGIKWIEDYMNIDLTPLSQRRKDIYKKFYLSEKSSEIAKTSIQALCESILGKTDTDYTLHQYRLTSEIIICPKPGQAYEIMLYLKPFLENPSVLTELLNNPHEIKIDDVLSCGLIEDEEEVTEAAV